MKLNITTGRQSRPQKVVIYGPEGIGKTTLASQFPRPLFIDTEHGTSHLDVARISMEKDTTWDNLNEIISEVAQQDVCKTLVLDSIDWAEQICVAHLLKKYRQTSIEGFGYGKGYTYLAEEVSSLLERLDAVIASGKHVVLVAHAKMRKQELPDEAGAFDRWELKLSRQAAPLVKEWADAVLFLNYRVYVSTNEAGHGKATGGKRVIYTTHAPCWDAKNRVGLPDCIETLSFDAIRAVVDGPADDSPSLAGLMARDGITEQQLRDLLSKSPSYNPESPLSAYAPKLIAKWDHIVNSIK